MKLKDLYKPNTSYKAFLVSVILIGFSFGLYKGVLDNYLAQIVHIGEFGRGVTEFFRELPGLFLILILALFSRFTSNELYRLGGLFLLFGLLLIGLLPPLPTLAIFAIFIYSIGEHIQLGMKSTISLEYSQKGYSGLALGVLNSLINAGGILGFLIISAIFLLNETEQTFRIVFFIALAISFIGFLVSFKMGKGEAKADIQKFYFRKKFSKYYMLEIFYGSRKQIFLTFGPYVLILFYKANTSTISLLFAIAAICGFLFSPLIGKIIDKLGYKVVMVADTLILVVVCFFYGFSHHFFSFHTAFIICSINYILDSIISLASMASNVYVEDLSDNTTEMRATISTGISVNHLISVLIALFGGYIWQTLGIETLFVLSAILGIINSLYAATIKTNRKK